MLEIQPISLVDLAGQAKTPQLNSAVVDGLADRCMREIRQNLIDLMRSPVQILSCATSIAMLDTCLSDLPKIILGAIINIAALNSRMLVIVDGGLVGAVVDRMCGASAPSFVPRGELSLMETRIGKKIIEDTLHTLMNVIGTLAPVRLTPVQYESAIAMLAIGDGRDWMFTGKGVVETSTGSGSLTVLCPIAAFDNLDSLPGFTTSNFLGQQTTDPRWDTALNNLLDTIMVQLSIEIARSELQVSVAENLRAGQILPFILLPDAIGVIAGIDIFRADYGQNNGFVSCRPKEPEQAGATSTQFEKEIKMPANTAQVELEPLTPLTPGTLAVAAKPVERVPVTLSVELGRTSISLKDLRQLRHGQVVVLDRLVGEPLSIYANGQRLAMGEVVAVAKNQYGVRVTSLIEDAEPQKELA